MKSLFEELKIYSRVDDHIMVCGPLKNLEWMIATDAFWSYVHVRYVIKGGFELAEGVMAVNENLYKEYQEFLETL